MNVEIPVCKRCCICLPLRYGLLALGYVRLAFSSLLFVGLCVLLNTFIKIYNSKDERYRITLINLLAVCSVTIVDISDIIMTIVFIIGCHKKNVRLMKMYYRFNKIILGCSVIVSIYSFVMTIHTVNMLNYPLVDKVMDVFLDILVSLANIVILVYVLLLIRSEFKKLDDSCQFRFENNTINAECTMKIEETTQGKRTENEKRETEDGVEIRLDA